ncbi:MAG: glutamine amidotransferase [Gammaproteobacteria bacterium RIFCSPHIGHO2_12_FULL_37_14]|nr:MAG: glutamine amidotransferase [Gammaproteobacteria bacterium RIFCSPHIGHO2_12_FULL_37_14]
MKAFLYILDTLADWEIGYIIAELNSGRFFNKTKTPVNLIKIGDTTKPIKTMGGIIITPNENINNIVFNKSDILILPGADTWFEDSNKKIMNLIPELLDQNVTIAAICGATLALAKNGILNTRKHTSNDKEFLKMSCPEYSGEELYLNQPAVTDGNLITATGLAPLEFSYEVFKKINIMNPETLEAWYQLNKTREAKYFYTLVESLK